MWPLNLLYVRLFPFFLISLFFYFNELFDAVKTRLNMIDSWALLALGRVHVWLISGRCRSDSNVIWLQMTSPVHDGAVRIAKKVFGIILVQWKEIHISLSQLYKSAKLSHCELHWVFMLWQYSIQPLEAALNNYLKKKVHVICAATLLHQHSLSSVLRVIRQAVFRSL